MDGFFNKSLKFQGWNSLANERAFTATEWRFKKSKDGFFNKNLMKK